MILVSFQIRIKYSILTLSLSLSTCMSDLLILICLAWWMQSLVLYQCRIEKNLWCFLAGAEETSPAACSEVVWLGAWMSLVACEHDSTEILYGTMDLYTLASVVQCFSSIVERNQGNLCYRDLRRQIFQCWRNTCNRLLHLVTNEWIRRPNKLGVGGRGSSLRLVRTFAFLTTSL